MAKPATRWNNDGSSTVVQTGGGDLLLETGDILLLEDNASFLLLEDVTLTPKEQTKWDTL